MFDFLACCFRASKTAPTIEGNDLEIDFRFDELMQGSLGRAREQNLKKRASRRKLRRDERKKHLEQRAGELSASEQKELDSIYEEVYPKGFNRRIRHLLQEKRW